MNGHVGAYSQDWHISGILVQLLLSHSPALRSRHRNSESRGALDIPDVFVQGLLGCFKAAVWARGEGFSPREQVIMPLANLHHTRQSDCQPE